MYCTVYQSVQLAKQQHAITFTLKVSISTDSKPAILDGHLTLTKCNNHRLINTSTTGFLFKNANSPTGIFKLLQE